LKTATTLEFRGASRGGTNLRRRGGLVLHPRRLRVLHRRRALAELGAQRALPEVAHRSDRASCAAILFPARKAVRSAPTGIDVPRRASRGSAGSRVGAPWTAAVAPSARERRGMRPSTPRSAEQWAPLRGGAAARVLVRESRSNTISIRARGHWTSINPPGLVPGTTGGHRETPARFTGRVPSKEPCLARRGVTTPSARARDRPRAPSFAHAARRPRTSSRASARAHPRATPAPVPGGSIPRGAV